MPRLQRLVAALCTPHGVRSLALHRPLPEGGLGVSDQERYEVEMEFTEVNPDALALITGTEPRAYRKLPVEIEAMQWPGSATLATLVINWILENGGTARYHEERTIPASWPLPEEHIPESIAIDTLEGQMSASAGDWIIKGVKGEFYPVKADIFQKTYEVIGS